MIPELVARRPVDQTNKLPLFLFSLQRVLTAEYIDGCNVDDVEELQRRGLDIADVSLCILLVGPLFQSQWAGFLNAVYLRRGLMCT